MNEEQAFWKEIQAHPEDRTTMLIYSDWLKERGDAFGDFVQLLAETPNWMPEPFEIPQVEFPPDPEWLSDQRLNELFEHPYSNDARTQHLFPSDLSTRFMHIAKPRWAAQLNWEHGAREGNILNLTEEDGDEVMIVGCLNGDTDLLKRTIEVADLAEYQGRHLVILGLGVIAKAESADFMQQITLDAQLKFPGHVHAVMSRWEANDWCDDASSRMNQNQVQYREELRMIYREFNSIARTAYFPWYQSLPLAVKLPGRRWMSHTFFDTSNVQQMDQTIFTRKLTRKDFRDAASGHFFVRGNFIVDSAISFSEMVNTQDLIVSPWHNERNSLIQVAESPNVHIISVSQETPGYLLLNLDEEYSAEELEANLYYLD